jgi:hypothetical protein
MLRLQKLANVNKRRTLRALYAQTQAYPYAATLDHSVDRHATDPFSGIEAGKAAIWPGMVALKTVGENVRPQFDNAGGNPGARRPFGLFANFIGGELDEIGDRNEVGVWRGVGGVFEILAPVFVDTGLGAEAAREDGSASKEIYLTADDTSRLFWDNDARPGIDWHNSTARLVRRVSDKAIIIELLV